MRLTAVKMFVLLHQRYIQTPQGMEEMKVKILKGDIGYCPRVLCQKQPAIPYGESADPEANCPTYIFCPRCKGLFQPDYVLHR